MIKHIVMWKLKEELKGQTKKDVSNEMKHKLEDLKSFIKEIVTIEVGINILPADQAYDVVLYSEFKSMKELNSYQKHPKHLEIVEFIKRVVEKRVVVDYEV